VVALMLVIEYTLLEALVFMDGLFPFLRGTTREH